MVSDNSRVNLVALQMTSTPDVKQNLAFVEEALSTLPTLLPNLVVLPECFAYFGGRDRDVLAHAEPRGQGYIETELCRIARQTQCYIVSGTFPLPADDSDHFTASSLLISPAGEVLDEYQKIHMFDVCVNDNTGSYLESKYTQAGSKVVVVNTDIGKIGMAVCYDLRFSGLFEAMGDVDIIVLPAAFTYRTGEAHWHTLLRARAIEKQCFVVAAGQTGIHVNGRETYGHSLVYSPWGDLLAERASEPGLISAIVNLEERDRLKQNMPIAQHNRFRSRFER